MRTSRQSGVTRHFMELQEVLAGLCLTAVLTGTALELAGRTWRYCKGATAWTQSAQLTARLRTAWRGFVHDCPARPVLSATGELVAGPWRAAVVPEGVELHGATGMRFLPLPEGMTAEIRREGRPGEPERWTLALDWKALKAGAGRRNSARLVACRGEVCQ